MRDFEKGMGRGRYTLSLEHSGSAGKRVTESETNRREVNGQHQSEGDSSIEVKGDLTLGNISKTYNVPLGFLIQKLGLPDGISLDEKLGWLRKMYGFKMSDVEKIIKNYQNEKVESGLTGQLKLEETLSKEHVGQESGNRRFAGDYQSGKETMIEINGRYTLGSVSEKYNVPLNFLIQKLGLPEGISPGEKLGQLRRRYGFRMSDVEKIIREYLEMD